jgi:hypothetical protein
VSHRTARLTSGLAPTYIGVSPAADGGSPRCLPPSTSLASALAERADPAALAKEGRQMNATGTRRTAPLLAAIMAASAVAAAACGGGAPAVGAPPASRHTAAERAATLNWLAQTNQIWTRNDFAPLDRATTGEARAAYLAQENRTRSDPGPAGRPPLRLASVSITVPCHRGAATTFVAYGDTNVFTLGQSMQPVALVFRRVGGAWKLAVIVNQSSDSGHPGWPALCRSGAGITAPAVLAPADYAAVLSRTLDRAATGATETAAAAAPFGVNSFFTGPGSFTAQSATQIRQDRAGRVTLAEQFVPAGDSSLALPLAGGRGYWLVGVLTQTARYSSAAGIRKGTWPDGASIGPGRPAVVHHGTDTFITTYTAVDPLRSAGGRVTLDGFFGWPLTSVAS